MKLTTTKKRLQIAVAIGITAGMLTAQPVFAMGKPFKKFTILANDPEEDKPAKKNKTKAKAFASLNNNSVKIYPDAIKRDMHVIAKDNDGKEIDFFVFDIEGSLMQHYKMKAKDHTKISGLARGTYVYRVFCSDEETAAGKFEIR